MVILAAQLTVAIIALVFFILGALLAFEKSGIPHNLNAQLAITCNKMLASVYITGALIVWSILLK